HPTTLCLCVLSNRRHESQDFRQPAALTAPEPAMSSSRSHPWKRRRRESPQQERPELRSGSGCPPDQCGRLWEAPSFRFPRFSLRVVFLVPSCLVLASRSSYYYCPARVPARPLPALHSSP